MSDLSEYTSSRARRFGRACRTMNGHAPWRAVGHPDFAGRLAGRALGRISGSITPTTSNPYGSPSC